MFIQKKNANLEKNTNAQGAFYIPPASVSLRRLDFVGCNKNKKNINFGSKRGIG